MPREAIALGAADRILPLGSIGDVNVASALEAQTSRRIPVITQRTGGQNGIYLRFQSATGNLLLRPINRLQ